MTYWSAIDVTPSSVASVSCPARARCGRRVLARTLLARTSGAVKSGRRGVDHNESMGRAEPQRRGGDGSPARRGQEVIMADVAMAAGVSHMTVSRVLNGTARVSPETRARVEEALRTLGYRPNAAARALVTGRSGQPSGAV